MAASLGDNGWLVQEEQLYTHKHTHTLCFGLSVDTSCQEWLLLIFTNPCYSKKIISRKRTTCGRLSDLWPLLSGFLIFFFHLLIYSVLVCISVTPTTTTINDDIFDAWLRPLVGFEPISILIYQISKTSNDQRLLPNPAWVLQVFTVTVCTDRLLQYADAITRLTRLKVLIYYILYGCIFYMNLKNTAISHFHKAWWEIYHPYSNTLEYILTRNILDNVCHLCRDIGL